MPVTFAADHGLTVAAAGATTIARSTTGAVTAGNIVWLLVGWFGTGTISSVTDNSGAALTYVAVQNASPSGDRGVGLVRADAPAGLGAGTTITVTFSASQTDRFLNVISASGAATGAGGVGANSNLANASTTTWSTGSISIGAGSMLLGIAHEDGGGVTGSTPDAGVTEIFDSSPSSDTCTGAYRIEASGGSYAVSGAWNGTGTASSVAYVEIVATGGAAPAPRLLGSLGVGT